MKNFDPSLYLVTDPRMPWEECLCAVYAALKGGVTLVQLREKDKTPDEIREHARDLLALLKPFGVPLILNDHVELASEIGVQGVHLGKKDCTAAEARRILGPNALIGSSIESLEQLEQGEWDVCDYLSVSPVFPTGTKEDVAKAVGVEGARKMREAYDPMPWVAIGGIDLSNVASLNEAKLDGISVVSSLLLSENPEATARAFRKLFPGKLR